MDIDALGDYAYLNYMSIAKVKINANVVKWNIVAEVYVINVII